jgi:SAM-dependent methyltransferase
MTSIADHYDTHLAEHYSWLFGGLPERTKENRAYFEKLGLKGTGRALDIGCGSGFQSIPLAELGYRVTGVDLSKSLLGELRRNAGELPIETVCDDILHYIVSAKAADFELCVCMGDTLTHLVSFGDVQRLLRDVQRVLAPGGRFVLAFRDFTNELVGNARFIPVRGDERTVFTCFLEYEGDHVRVYDVIHRRPDDASPWEMKVSAYKKLRIGPDWLQKRVVEAGFTVESSEVRQGMATLVLRKA